MKLKSKYQKIMSFFFQFNNIFEAKSVFEQVTFSLAVAEEALQFEHRDLHWGNVLVKKTELKFHEYVVMGQTFKVESHGVHVSIIDFTLSRLVKGMYILPRGTGMIKNNYMKCINGIHPN